MDWILISFFAYMIFIVVVGFVAARRTAGGMESFYLGDRRVGAWVTAISASASSESGWLVLGCVAMGYIHGAAGYWITVGCVLGFAFNWFFFAERIRRQSAATGSLTVPEFLERATGDRTRLVRLIGVAIIFVLMFTYVAAQLTAAGTTVHWLLKWDYEVGVLIGAAVTILYTTVGGYRAVSWTDLYQGLLMAAALIVLPILAYAQLGGEVERSVNRHPAQTIHIFRGDVAGEATAVRVEEGKPARFSGPRGEALLAVSSIDGELVVDIGGVVSRLPEREDGTPVLDLRTIGLEGGLALHASHDLKGGDAFFSFFGGMAGLILLGWIIEMLGIGLGYPGSPHVVARFMAAKSRKEIVRGRAIALTWAVLAEAGAITVGILARGLFPDLVDPEWGLFESARELLHPALAGLVVAAVFAALRSTADSQLLVASSAIVRDLCEKVMGIEMDDARARRISRWVVVVLGVLAVLLSLQEARFIFWFVLFSWAGLGASFAPPLILAVFWKRLSAAGVIASMITGFGVTLLWKLVIRGAIVEAKGPDIYELVPAFFASLLAAVLFSLLFPRQVAQDQDRAAGDRVGGDAAG
jgi:sodium/proline symporter